MDQHTSIAILLFSRTAEAEASHKKWWTKTNLNHAVANHLIQRTRQELSATGLPVFHIDEKLQKGITFGEKLANAYVDIFSLGYDVVIAVGNDCPEVSVINWRQVKDELSAGRNVLGPNYRKGVYLIGLTKESFGKKAFANLSWQSDRLIDELINYCQNPVLLDRRRDINSRYDLAIAAEADPELRLFIRSLIKTRFEEFFLVLFSSFSPAAGSLRAPPAQAA